MTTIAPSESLTSVRSKINAALESTDALNGTKYPRYASTAAMSAATLADGELAQVGDLVFERQSGDTTTLPNLQGFVPKPPKSTAEIGHFGGVGDDATDNTDAFTAIVAYCTANSKPVDLGSGGTYLVDPITLTGSEKLILIGDPNNRPVIKLKPGPNGHVIQTFDLAVLDLYGVCLDNNRGNRAEGHGLRSGGAALIRLDQVRIQNCQEYGIGYQTGTTVKTEIGYIEVDTTGLDAVDIKDRDSANGPFVYEHIKCSNFALDDADGVGVDVRGAAYGKLIEADLTGACRAFRYRSGGTQGPAGYGRQESIKVEGEGAAGGNTFAVDWASDDPRATIGSVQANGAGGLIIQKEDAVGGVIDNAVAVGVYLADAMSFSGTNLTIRSGSITKDAAATGITSFVDFEPTSDRNTLQNFGVIDPTGNPRPIRIQAGATDTVLDLVSVTSSGVADNGVGDSGTNTLQRDPRSYTA